MVIYCPSPGQSGSTAFWNLVWNIFELKGIKCKKYLLSPLRRSHCIDYKSLKAECKKNKDTTFIIKAHERFGALLDENDAAFMIVRNLYQALSSGLKKERGVKPEQLINRYIRFYKQWKNDCGYIIQFDDFVNNKKEVVKNISHKLKLPLKESQVEKLIQDNNNIDYNYSETLLTRNHIHSKHTNYIHDLKSIPSNAMKYLKELEQEEELKELFS